MLEGAILFGVFLEKLCRHIHKLHRGELFICACRGGGAILMHILPQLLQTMYCMVHLYISHY